MKYGHDEHTGWCDQEPAAGVSFSQTQT